MFPVMFRIWVADVIPGCNVTEILSLQRISNTTPFKTDCIFSKEHVHLDICPANGSSPNKSTEFHNVLTCHFAKTEKPFLLGTHSHKGLMGLKTFPQLQTAHG